MRTRGGEAHCGAESLAGRSDAASWDQAKEGRCRSGYVFGLVSSTLRGPRHLLQWTPRLSERLVKCSSGKEVYTSGEMSDHVAHADLSPGMVGVEACASLFAHLRKKEAITEKYLAIHFAGIRRASDSGEPGNVPLFQDPQNPAGGLTEVESDMAPLLLMPQFGLYCPGALWPLRGATLVEALMHD